MRPSRLCSSFLALATCLVTSSLLAAGPEPLPAAPPAPLGPSGKQPDPLEVAVPVAPPPAPQLPPPQTTRPPVLEVPIQPPPRPKVEEEDEELEGYAQGDHFEFTMGFLAGQRSY